MITTYRITFDRIGRQHNVPPIAITLTEDDEVAYKIAKQVHATAWPHLISRDVEVIVDLGEEAGAGGVGTILAGFQSVGTFTVTPTLTTPDDDPDESPGGGADTPET